MNTIKLGSLAGGDRPDAYSRQVHDFPGLIRRMKQSNAWAKGNLNAMILEKNSLENVVLVALHEGTEIISYQSNDSITFRVIEGEMEFKSRNTSAALGMGQELTLNDKVKYRLKAMEETVMIMSIERDADRNGSGRQVKNMSQVNFWR